MKTNEYLKIDSDGKIFRKIGNGLKFGWTVKEIIGAAVVNACAVAKLSKKTIIGE